MFIAHPDDDAVKTALAAWEAAVSALNNHVVSCSKCQAHNPQRYKICLDGHVLAATGLAKRLAVQLADAAASGPGPARGGRR